MTCWGWWELNPGPVGEQPVLSTAEHSLQRRALCCETPSHPPRASSTSCSLQVLYVLVNYLSTGEMGRFRLYYIMLYYISYIICRFIGKLLSGEFTGPKNQGLRSCHGKRRDRGGREKERKRDRQTYTPIIYREVDYREGGVSR